MNSSYPQVILDARMILQSGIGTHIRGLLEGWREIAPDFHPTLLGDPSVLADLLSVAESDKVIPFSTPIYGIREQLAFPAAKTKGTLLHCPHYNLALRHCGPLVVTLHDLIHIDKQWGVPFGPRQLYARWMLRKAVARARHIFTVSMAVARTVMDQLGCERNKITVIHNAPLRLFLNSTPEPSVIESFRRDRQLPAEYFLTVGIYKPHKNLDLLLEVMKTLWETEAIQTPLVVAGIQGKDRETITLRLEQLRIADRVRVLERLPSEELPLLYRAAHAMIHPSVLEGFGLPVVESQAMGCPVVASRASAIPEVAGEGALFFEPRDREDMARQIVKVVRDETAREALIAKGRQNVERFSWRESARKVLSVYERFA